MLASSLWCSHPEELCFHMMPSFQLCHSHSLEAEREWGKELTAKWVPAEKSSSPARFQKAGASLSNQA